MSHVPHDDKPSIALPVTAIVALVVCWPIGLILSIVSAAKFMSAAGTEARTLSIVALVLNVVFIPVFVAIIGILAAIAIPNYIQFQCRAKQSEAKGNLKALYVAEESYRAERDTYSPCSAEECNGANNVIGFTPKGATVRYTYTVLTATKEEFKAEARGTGEMEGDLWTIDQNNNLQNVTNSCGR